MWRALLRKRKFGSKVYLSAIAGGLGVYLGKKILVSFPCLDAIWSPLPRPPPSYLPIRIQSVFYAGLAKSVWWGYGRLLYFIGLWVSYGMQT